jgi:ornithine cyclodeaminase/alanine dehydrogenase-like protein (mu-crystallin family)
VLVLGDDDVSGALSPSEVISAVERALRDLESGVVRSLPREHVHWDASSMLTMPAVGVEHVGVKIVSVVPDNRMRGLPVTTGLMMLNDRSTGVCRAVMGAAALTARRTAAVGAVGIKHTTPSTLSTVGIVGTGVQGVWQAIYACTVRPVQRLTYYARSDESAQRFERQVRAHVAGVSITRCDDVSSLLRESELVIAATTSHTPVLPDSPEHLEGKHFVSVGSFRPHMQELPDSVYRLTEALVIDSDQAREEVGDVIRATAANLLSPQNIFHLCELVCGRRVLNVEATTAFKSVGLALYDLYVAGAIYDAAMKSGLGREIPL